MLDDAIAKASELRQRLDNWLAAVDAKLPTPDPEYDPELEETRLRELEHRLMLKLEAEHAEYLDPDWHPNAWKNITQERCHFRQYD